MPITKKFKLLMSLLLVMISITSCGVQETDLIKISSSDSETIGSNAEDNYNSSSIGRFIQKDITPMDITNASITTFSKSNNGELLSIYDNEAKEPKAFIFQDKIWTEKNNTPIVTFLGEKTYTNLNAFLDFSDNWWAFYKDSEGVDKGFQILNDGSVKEIILPQTETISFVTNLQLSDSGIIYLNIYGEALENSDQELYHIVINSKTGEIIENQLSVQKKRGYLVEDKIFFIGDRLNAVDYKTGNLLESFTLPNDDFLLTATIDKTGNISFLNNRGIHRIRPNGSTIETVIDDNSFAYVNTEYGILLEDDKNENYMYACGEGESFKVYEYSFDKSIATNKSDELTIWLWGNNRIVDYAIPFFTEKYPDVEVEVEIFEKKEGVLDPTLPEFAGAGHCDFETARIFNEDNIKKINTKLLSGEAPDVLISDGFQIDKLYQKGLLSEFNLDLDESQYYENIMDDYASSNGVYAYPSGFRFEVLLSYDDTREKTNFDTLDKVIELIPNSLSGEIPFVGLECFFDIFYNATYFNLFPDEDTLNEDNLENFLTKMKEIYESDGGWDPQNTPSKISRYFSMFIWPFEEGENLKIYPLIEGNYKNEGIASIPADAQNKEHGENFIKVLLSDEVQSLTDIIYFPVKKEVGIEKAKKTYTVDDWDEITMNRSTVEGIARFESYDWDSLIESLNNPVESDSNIENIIFEQTSLYLNDIITIDDAVSEIMKKVTLIISEGN